MATKGMLKPVHIIKSNELEQLADAYDASKAWWEKNVKGKPRKRNFVELKGEQIDELMAHYRGNSV